MFTTAKEIHVYIDSSIQQLNSNRKLSIAPELIDMYVNSTIRDYITSKVLPSDRGLEEYKYRNTEFANLKKSFKGFPYYNAEGNVAYYVLPNALLIEGCNIKYAYKKSENNKTTTKKYSANIIFNSDFYTDNSFQLVILVMEGLSTRTVNVDLTNILNRVKSKDGIFYFYQNFIDTLRNDYDLNIKQSNNNSFIIEFPIGQKLLSFSCNSSKVTTSISSTEVTSCKIGSALMSSGTIYPFYEVGNQLRNPIRMNNSHKNPVCSVTDVFEVQCPTFDCCSAEILYIKYPRLINIFTGAVPEIPITEELLNMVAKNILLDSNNSYERQINELKTKQ